MQLGKFYPIRGGVEKVAYDLTVGLSELGVDCDMMCAADHGGSRTHTINGHAGIICCRTWLKAAATMIAPAMIFALRKICGQYDIIHVHHPDPMACLALFLSGYKGRVILHWHSDIQKQRFLLKLYRPLQSWLLRRGDLIVGTTPVYLSESPFLQKVQDKTVCLPIGVEAMHPDSRAVEAIRSRYGHRKIVFSLGRLVAYKGYCYLIAAAKYLKDDYVVLIGGTGALKDELQKEIDELDLRGKVELLGRVSDSDLPAYYGACDVFCLSSVQKTEAFGIVQIEAMSCGKPVIATNIPQSGVSWVNRHGASGLNVPPGNAPELAKAIETVTEDGTTYRKYSDGAARRYRDLFTKEDMIKKCLNIYDTVMKNETVSLAMHPDASVGREENVNRVRGGFVAARVAKRAFDIVGSLLGLIVSLPAALVICCLIKREDRGSAIFRQERIGYGGQPFTLYKFRSMTMESEADGKPLLCEKDDTRLTKVGGFLRRHHLDELPQLWNVLKGDMSFVGPRPERKFFVDKIMAVDPRYSLLYNVRPGLFSPATLYNGYTDTMEKMLVRLRMDLRYMHQWSLWLDFKIIVLTVVSIISGKEF